MSTFTKVILGILAAFAAFVLAWYLLIKAPYVSFCKQIVESGGEHIITSSTAVERYKLGDHVYTVTQPSFLKNNGTLDIKKTSQPVVDLHIYRSLAGKYSYDIIRTDGYEPDTTTLAFSFATNMRPVAALSDAQKTKLGVNEELFLGVLDEANSMWGLTLEMNY